MRQPKEGLCASATAAAVADKSNARVTISAALAAGAAGLDDSRNARLPPGSLFIGGGQDLFFSGLQLLAEDTAPSAAVSCCIFPALTIHNFENHYLQFLLIFNIVLQGREKVNRS